MVPSRSLDFKHSQTAGSHLSIPQKALSLQQKGRKNITIIVVQQCTQYMLKILPNCSCFLHINARMFGFNNIFKMVIYFPLTSI